jgi:hypothetical protein
MESREESDIYSQGSMLRREIVALHLRGEAGSVLPAIGTNDKAIQTSGHRNLQNTISSTTRGEYFEGLVWTVGRDEGTPERR